MLETERDQTGPHIKQLSLFLENRLGALLGVIRKLEAHRVHICAVSIVDAADHAVVRMITDRPAVAKEALAKEGYKAFETELIGVEVPMGKGIGMRKILAALLVAEINVQYVYSLMVHHHEHPVIALHVDDKLTASRVLNRQGLQLVGQDEIEWPAE